MTDILTALERSEMMSRIRGKDTRPELFVRRALHALGYRFRTHSRAMPGTPDLVFSKRRMAVFCSRVLLAPTWLQKDLHAQVSTVVLAGKVRRKY